MCSRGAAVWTGPRSSPRPDRPVSGRSGPLFPRRSGPVRMSDLTVWNAHRFGPVRDFYRAVWTGPDRPEKINDGPVHEIAGPLHL